MLKKNYCYRRCSDNPLPIEASEEELRAGGVQVSVAKIKKISSNLPDNQLRYSIGLTFAEATPEE